MFATILGALPRPALPPTADLDELVAAALEAQATAGLEPVTDGRLRWRTLDDAIEGGAGPTALEAWRRAVPMATRAVKATLPGPYTLGRRAASSDRARRTATLEAAARVRDEARALAAAGCPFVEVLESEAAAIGADDVERGLFRDAHLALTEGVAGTHLSLVLVGPSADQAGIETILAAPYASLAVDLIEGPDAWRLVARTPGDRGIIVGAMAAGEGVDDGLEILLFAARYAASTGGRGPSRVGLAVVPGLEHLSWRRALEKMRHLGEADRLAALPPGPELARQLDPRAIDARSSATGRIPSDRRRPR